MTRTSSAMLAALILSLIACFPWCLHAAQPEAKKYFQPDPPDMPAYTLPDVLTAADGRKITTSDDWIRIRRPEILELFRKNVYGRVPATPYQESFKVVNEDSKAMDGAATLKQVDITIAAGGKSLIIHLVLFVPNKVSKPVPTFLLICNRGVKNIDPTRATKSDFWPAEEVIGAATESLRFTMPTWTPTRTTASRTASMEC